MLMSCFESDWQRARIWKVLEIDEEL